LRSRSLSVALIVGALAVGIAAGYVAGVRRDVRSAGQASLRPLRPAPHYVLTDQMGRSVDSTSFDGDVQIVTFLFPYCTTYCPLIAADLVQFELVLKGTDLAKRVRIVAFNVDPAGSGPAQMRAFMREYGWNPSDTRWEFLTGSPSAIRRVVTGGYMISFERESLADEAREEAKERAAGEYVPQPEVQNEVAQRANVDYDIVHNDALEIVGPDGRIYKIFEDAEKVTSEQLLATIHAIPGVTAD